MKARRRRGLLLLALALASGGLAASTVRERERSVEARVGPLVPVLVAARDLPADARLRRGALALRRVPARFVPPDALGSPEGVVGSRTAVPMTAGAYLTAGQLRGAREGARRGDALGPGERAVEVGVVGGGELASAVPGSLVDVVVSTETGAGGGRSFVALAGVELLRLGPGSDAGYAGAEDPDASAPGALATLRVSVRQAVYLTAADNFGREIRLLIRPPGDRARTAAETAAAEL